MAVPNFPIDEAYLIGSWLESFFWGLYTLLFAMSMHTIYQKRKEGINKFTTCCLVLLYLLASGHMSLGLTRLIQGFIVYRDTIGPIAYFSSVWLRVNMAKDYLYITTMFTGDLVVVWRLYVVWGKNYWYALLPFLMCVSEFIVGYGAVSQWLLPHPDGPEMVRWGTAMFSISMATNVCVTAVIASRIWYVSMRTQRVMGVESSGRYNRVILLIVESGALISATKLTEFVLFRIAPGDGIGGLNAMYILYEIVPQITGIVPTMIIYAVNKGFTQRDNYYTSHKTTLAFATRSGTEPTAHTNTSLSAVVFAPSDLDMPSKKAAAEKARMTEKLQLKRSPESSLADEQV
ncbi:hypothetical protein C8Q70DRAFT_1049959 [Cubamyces menziesii]|uniref:Uncharacterized protein n=1 Tax=Trametes cubensis TaxID=1111947 RepID=A0AAD7U2C0_9APHY|nr:hypothetical protein C8Q70DRAFT_1049959 [Cubamyces menziesii]KAJ8496077.1 hypothetical protein ONZ51_g1343 [Trametes cubensis]